MNRRDFLHPRRLSQLAGPALAPPEPPPPADVALFHAGRRAMATLFEVLVPFGLPQALPAAEDAHDLIDRLEDQMTVYRDDSEVAAINRRAALEPVPVEEGLFGLFESAARTHRETLGAFDVTTGALTKAWGFYKRQGRVPGGAERAEALARTGMRHVELDADRRTIRFLRPGVEINLGSIGKGYALDRVGGLLRQEWGIDSGMVHGGASSVLAVGTPPGDPRGWAVGVAHPWDAERRLATVRLRNRAVGTSAATYQHFVYHNRRLGHLLDPRTGWPARGTASATVAAPTAAEADALSTAFFILGADFARRYCQARPDVSALVLPEGDGAGLVALNWAPEDVTLSPPGRPAPALEG
jgi:thiamine biosynthesis lipoprotein